LIWQASIDRYIDVDAAGLIVPQVMVHANGIQKGLETILMERGLYQVGMSKLQMQRRLNEQPDFRDQEHWLEEIIHNKADSSPGAMHHHIIYLPKYHPELNWIERYWGYAKARLRRLCTYEFAALKANLPRVLDECSLETMRRFARKCWRYMDAYRGGNLTAEQAEWATKKYKSHRRIPNKELIPEMMRTGKVYPTGAIIPVLEGEGDVVMEE
jgi:hypothetical protein